MDSYAELQWKSVTRNLLKGNLRLLESLNLFPSPCWLLFYFVYKKPPHLRNHFSSPFRFLITVVHCIVSTTHPKYRTKGLAIEMYKRSLQFLKAEGYKLVDCVSRVQRVWGTHSRKQDWLIDPAPAVPKIQCGQTDGQTNRSYKVVEEMYASKSVLIIILIS